MTIKEYDFTKFTNKDMFNVRLAGTIPEFEYISCKKRKPFLDFCVELGFLSYYGTTSNGLVHLYNVHTTFRFSAMFTYAPRIVVAASDNNMILVSQDFKMTNTRI